VRPVHRLSALAELRLAILRGRGLGRVRLLTRGRSLLTEQDPHTAAKVLAEALALWRGTPLADPPPLIVLMVPTHAFRQVRTQIFGSLSSQSTDDAEVRVP